MGRSLKAYPEMVPRKMEMVTNIDLKNIFQLA